MKKRIIYGTKVSVDNMILEAEKEMKIYYEEVAEVFLMGYIYLCSQRKLFGIIPLPNKHDCKVFTHIFVRNKYTGSVHATVPSLLSLKARSGSWRRHRTWSHGCATSASSTSKANRRNNKKADGQGKPIHPPFD